MSRKKNSTKPGNFLSAAESERVVAAIREAESRTTGEIRIRVERNCPGEPMARARAVFAGLGMHGTADRNAVLIYLSLTDRQFALFGDDALHGVVGDAGWNRLRDRALARFRKSQFADGLVEIVGELGRTLAERFPARPGDRNELKDDISFEK